MPLAIAGVRDLVNPGGHLGKVAQQPHGELPLVGICHQPFPEGVLNVCLASKRVLACLASPTFDFGTPLCFLAFSVDNSPALEAHHHIGEPELQRQRRRLGPGLLRREPAVGIDRDAEPVGRHPARSRHRNMAQRFAMNQSWLILAHCNPHL